MPLYHQNPDCPTPILPVLYKKGTIGMTPFYRGVLSYQNNRMCLNVNTRMIRLYRTITVSKDLNNTNRVTLIVKLYSVTMNNRNLLNVSSFDRTPRSMCGQVPNNEHATSHHLTRLNAEFADLIATCNMTIAILLRYRINNLQSRISVQRSFTRPSIQT